MNSQAILLNLLFQAAKINLFASVVNGQLISYDSKLDKFYNKQETVCFAESAEVDNPTFITLKQATLKQLAD